MKIYLASNFMLKNEVVYLSTVLESFGFEITTKWWVKDYKEIAKVDEAWYKLPDVIAVSKRNFEAIKNADALVFVAHPNIPMKFNGANIELGFALALEIRCFGIGKFERSAMYVPLERCTSKKELLEQLLEMKKILEETS